MKIQIPCCGARAKGGKKSSPFATQVTTTPYAGQAPGTSGLRKKVKDFQQPHYLENFIQATFDSLKGLGGQTLVVSGDGRYYNTEAINIIVRMAAANSVGKVLIGLDGLLSTPAVSYLIRKYKCYGGIILTASHNPGGPTEDFGVKYNISNGGPATQRYTDDIYANTKTIERYYICETPLELDLSKVGSTDYCGCKIEIIDGAKDYGELMKGIFDFPALKKFVARKDFTMVYDGMSGVAGPFAKEIFINELEMNNDVLLNCDPLPDFGGLHPDPNLVHAKQLCDAMGLGKGAAKADFGAAADGDADRNMILGKNFFVTPSDSLAVIAANAQECIPYFKNGVKGVARSMPTSGALDLVAEKLEMKTYEVPTGWKFFGNLMDAGQISLCGEESFGTGSDHIREKDGIWAVLAWLSILMKKNENSKKLISVSDIVNDHWKIYGRNYYVRHDFEQVEQKQADSVMDVLRDQMKKLNESSEAKLGGLKVKEADEFEYKDLDGSVASKQGLRFMFENKSRIVFRLSGTGTGGATIRMYIEAYDTNISMKPEVAVKPLIAIGMEISKIKQLTGKAKADVET